jgi:hypothetical protein
MKPKPHFQISEKPGYPEALAMVAKENVLIGVVEQWD